MKVNRLLLLVAAIIVSASLANAADQSSVLYERNVPVKMRDGVTLRADIFRPKGASPANSL